jgi:hypothetical protein
VLGMYRIALSALVIVVGLAVVLVVSNFTQGETPTPAVAQTDQAETLEPSVEVELRPGQLADPGPVTVNTRGWATDFGISSISYSEVLSGGVPKDGIPSLSAPNFESIADARTWLDGVSPVISLEIDGVARAYPLAILTWHEIVNDELNGTPVAVTFCPLCHTALVYDRTLDGSVHDFGVSGNLRFSDMIMFDRQTETWWQQATGKGIVGVLTGTKLDFLPSQIISLDDFATTYPDADVLSRDTGHGRRYGDNPYVGYDTADSQPFLFGDAGGRLETDGRRLPMERVVTLGEGGEGNEPVAFPYTEIRSTGVAQLDFEGEPVVVFWTPGTTSALDGRDIDQSEDVGSTGVFSAVVDGQTLTFSRAGGEDGAITDAETGSTWDITGRAIDGPMAGTALEAIAHGDHFWFAWAAFTPDTRIWTIDGTISAQDAV